MRRAIERSRSWRRAVPVYPEPEAPRPRSRKNTRRWCRGRVGVEHRTSWKLDHRGTWYVRSCDTCGREFQHCFELFNTCLCGHHGRR